MLLPFKTIFLRRSYIFLLNLLLISDSIYGDHSTAAARDDAPSSRDQRQRSTVGNEVVSFAFGRHHGNIIEWRWKQQRRSAFYGWQRRRRRRRQLESRLSSTALRKVTLVRFKSNLNDTKNSTIFLLRSGDHGNSYPYHHEPTLMMVPPPPPSESEHAYASVHGASNYEDVRSTNIPSSSLIRHPHDIRTNRFQRIEMV